MSQDVTSILYVGALYKRNLALGLRKKPEGHVTSLLHPLREVRVAVAVSRLTSRGSTTEHCGKNSVCFSYPRIPRARVMLPLLVHNVHT